MFWGPLHCVVIIRNPQISTGNQLGTYIPDLAIRRGAVVVVCGRLHWKLDGCSTPSEIEAKAVVGLCGNLAELWLISSIYSHWSE